MRLVICIIVFWSAQFSLAAAETARIAVATNFRAPMEALVAQFERETSHKLVVTYGATGKLYAQISRHAPFDVFLAADTERPALLVENGIGVEGSPFVYASGALALIGHAPTSAALKTQFESGAYKTIAIANPNLAPYGLAAEVVLKKYAENFELDKKILHGENVGQAYALVVAGGADLGFVALSSVIGSSTNDRPYWAVPIPWHPPIEQGAVLLKRGERNSAASAFVDFLRSDDARAHIENFGYVAAGGAGEHE